MGGRSNRLKKWSFLGTTAINPIIIFPININNISEDELLRANSGEMRKIAIYMIKKHTGTTNKHIGELFGGIIYSAVAKTYQRFLNQLREDKSLWSKISEIDNEMSYVKGWPYIHIIIDYVKMALWEGMKKLELLFVIFSLLSANKLCLGVIFELLLHSWFFITYIEKD